MMCLLLYFSKLYLNVFLKFKMKFNLFLIYKLYIFLVHCYFFPAIKGYRKKNIRIT